MDDNNDARQSADDALEPQDDIFNPKLDEETLAEDNESPAAPADDVTKHAISEDDPRLDSGVDTDELYNEGEGQASGADDTDIRLEDQPKPIEWKDEE
jgi:hypothetical protein